MIKKELGKIVDVYVGLGGYQDNSLGIHFTFESKGWGVSDSNSFWDINNIEHSEYTKWSEEDRKNAYYDIMVYISNLLKEANVRKVEQLKNIPVEVIFEDDKLKSWRILTEVL